MLYYVISNSKSAWRFWKIRPGSLFITHAPQLYDLRSIRSSIGSHIIHTLAPMHRPT